MPLAHGLLVREAPARRAGGKPVDHVDGQADEFVGKHAAAAQAGSSVVVIHDGDAGAGADVVVGFIIEIADGAGVVMALQVAAHLVVAIAQAIGKKAALGVQQQARGLDGAGGDDDDVGELFLQVAASSK